ncbi:family 1 glycosylhydrolase, partial [Enterococcus faecium]
FTDCVSPMNAFKNRYGLVRIELNDERSRTLKKSASWYQTLIDKRELDLPDEIYK